jgi:hypothetical protein
MKSHRWGEHPIAHADLPGLSFCHISLKKKYMKTKLALVALSSSLPLIGCYFNRSDG